MNWKKQLLRYWLAMNASAVQSCAHSAKAWVATAALHAADDSIPVLNLAQFAAVLAFFFGQALLDYLDKNPLPKLASPMEEGK